MPTVSVIISTFNRASLLRDAISSVLSQTYEDYEVIVVDDGSSDNTREVVAEFVGTVRYFLQDHHGCCAPSRNRGILESTGRYLLFLDDDDLLLPESLALLSAFLEAHPDVGVVHSDGIYHDSEGGIVRESPIRQSATTTQSTDYLQELALHNAVGPIHSAMIRREWLQRVDQPCFDESLLVVEDVDLWYRLAAVGCTFEYLGRLTCKYRRHTGNCNTPGFLVNQRHRESYLRSHLKIFYSETFLKLLPSTQTAFLYQLLLDPVLGDVALRKSVVASERFHELPAAVQAQVLYLLATDDLLKGVGPSLATRYLAHAVALNPHNLKYRVAHSLTVVSPTTVARVISTVRRVRNRRIALSPLSSSPMATVGQETKRSV